MRLVHAVVSINVVHLCAWVGTSLNVYVRVRVRVRVRVCIVGIYGQSV